MSVSVVVLAAGQGSRMKSELPKVLHPIAGEPMVVHAVEAVQGVSETLPVLVVAAAVEPALGALGDQVRFVVQQEALGTGHAVLQARSLFVDPSGSAVDERKDAGESDLVLVTYADKPLLRTETLRNLVAHHRLTTPVISMLTVVHKKAGGFGRVLRDAAGGVVAVIEEIDATPEQLNTRELNAGVFCFDAAWLWSRVGQIPKSANGEYYLTDLVGMAVKEGHTVETVTVESSSEVLGINTRVHLAEAEAEMRKRINEKWMLAGVTVVDPATTYIEAGVTLGPDTVIHPNTFLEGETRIGAKCRLGPNTVIRDSTLGDGCSVFASVLEGGILEDQVDVGPFGHLRKGAHLAAGVHMGNFGEVKNAYLGDGTKMGHFSYVGDATIESGVNVGAGVIICNYDGQRKHHTEIGQGAFIGSGVMLVAPVRVGRAATIGAGSVVTRDVPAESLAFGVPARVQHRDPPADAVTSASGSAVPSEGHENHDAKSVKGRAEKREEKG